jgi:hypothetical protein
MEEVFPKIEGILFLHKFALHSREALVEAAGLLPSVQTLPVAAGDVQESFAHRS